jgi:DNA-binding response OmpR family regulator
MSKLLIVDDEVDIREFAKNYFRKRSVDVYTASGGNEALEIIRQERPDLVLLDVRMEGMNGVELLRKLRESGDPTRVVMVTGVKEEATIQETEHLGVIGYIHKPLILDELEKIVLKELRAA